MRNAWVARHHSRKVPEPSGRKKPGLPIPMEMLPPKELRMGVISNKFPLTLAGVSGKLSLVIAQVLARKQFLSLAGCHEAVVNINSIPV